MPESYATQPRSPSQIPPAQSTGTHFHSPHELRLSHSRPDSHVDARAHSYSSRDADILLPMEQKTSGPPRKRTRQSGTGDPLPHASGLPPAKRPACLKEPPPDFTTMHAKYNRLYFGNELHSFSIQWSNSQTRCSGITFFDRRLISISSRILLDPRMPHEDLVDTILHEMIHVQLFLEGHRADSANHGPRFRQQPPRMLVHLAVVGGVCRGHWTAGRVRRSLRGHRKRPVAHGPGS